MDRTWRSTGTRSARGWRPNARRKCASRCAATRTYAGAAGAGCSRRRRRSYGSSAAWRAASPCRVGRANTAARAIQRDEAALLQQEMRRIGARPPLTSFGISMLGPALLSIRHGRTEGRASAAHRARRNPLVPGLFRARRRLRPRVPQHQGRGQGRSLSRQRSEDLDFLRRQGRLDLLPGAHQPRRQEAARHFVPAYRHGDAGRIDAADRADLR